MNKFTKTIFTVTVLSEQPIPEEMEFLDIVTEAEQGAFVYSSGMFSAEVETLNEAEMAKEMIEIGSEPEFFGIIQEN